MTTDCLPRACYGAADRRLHDAIVGLAVAVIFIIPATLVAFTVI